MKSSRTTRRFRKLLVALPAAVQEEAREAYRTFRADPSHPSLHFKKLGGAEDLYSARIGISYRAVAVLEDDTFVWVWIGSHAAFDRLF